MKQNKGCRVSNSRPTDMPISSKRVHCCIHVSRVFFFLVGMLPFIVRTYVPRVCCVIPCPILLVRTWYHTVFSCDNNSVFTTLHSKQHQFFCWDV